MTRREYKMEMCCIKFRLIFGGGRTLQLIKWGTKTVQNNILFKLIKLVLRFCFVFWKYTLILDLMLATPFKTGGDWGNKRLGKLRNAQKNRWSILQVNWKDKYILFVLFSIEYMSKKN